MVSRSGSRTEANESEGDEYDGKGHEIFANSACKPIALSFDPPEASEYTFGAYHRSTFRMCRCAQPGQEAVPYKFLVTNSVLTRIENIEN